jgi:hypothetical protein
MMSVMTDFSDQWGYKFRHHTDSLPDAVLQQKSPHLLLSHVIDQGSILYFRASLKVCGRISAKESGGSDDIRPLNRSFEAFDQHEERVIARKILGLTVLHSVPPGSICRTGGPAMQGFDVGEIASSPSQHVGFDLIDRVPPRTHPEAVHGIPARAPIDFGRAPNVEKGTGFRYYNSAFDVVEQAATDAQLRVMAKLIETSLEVVGPQAEVAVQVNEEIPVPKFQSAVSVKKGFDGADVILSLASIGPVQGGYPGMLGGKTINDLPGPVGRAVINDHPLHRAGGLMDHGRDGLGDMLRFIARRSDYDVPSFGGLGYLIHRYN